MSIVLAALTTATRRAISVPPQAMPPNAAAEVPATTTAFVFFLIWGSVGLLLAGLLGAFRRRSTVGPERLAPDESAYTLLGVFCGGLFVLFAVVIASSSVAADIAHRLHHPAGTDTQQNAIGGVADGCAAAFMLFAMHRLRPEGLRRAGLQAWRLPVAVGGALLGLFILFPLVQLVGIAVLQAYRWLHLAQPHPHELLEMVGRDHKWTMVLLTFAVAAVAAPVAEELAFRGLLQTAFARAFAHVGRFMTVSGPDPRLTGTTSPGARWAAIVATSLLFAASHYDRPASLPPIFVLSLGLGYLYERSGSLWLTIVTHGLFNSVQIVWFLSGG